MPLIARDKFRFESLQKCKLFSITDISARCYFCVTPTIYAGITSTLYTATRAGVTRSRAFSRACMRIEAAQSCRNYLAVIYDTRGYPLTAATVASIHFSANASPHQSIMPTKEKKRRVVRRINGRAADKTYRFANYGLDLLSRGVRSDVKL